MAAWDPTVQQSVEADTLLMPDLTSIATLNAAGGLLEAAQHASQASASGNYVLTTGKFTPSIRPTGTGPGRFVTFPSDGIIAGDQATVEWWMRHPTTAWGSLAADKMLFEINTPTLYMPIKTDGAGGLVGDWAIYPHLSSAPHVVKTFTVASVSVASGTWASLALVIGLDDTVKFYIDGTLKATITGFAIPTVISDDMKEGIRFAGTDSGPSGFAFSDVRFSRTARVPSQTPTLKSLTGTLAINATAVAGDVPADLLGGLHGFPASTPTGEAETVISTMRTDKFLVVTPIKAGATNGTHPTLGASGSYSYDWQVVDRSLQALSDRGIKAWISLDACPQLLGGSVAPYSGTDLTAGLAYTASYPTEVPNDTTAYATMCSDLVHHINGLDVEVFCYSVHNEPDAVGWAGTRAQFMTMYAAVAAACRAADAVTPIIGAEITAVYGNTAWINDLIDLKIAGTPLDAFSYHGYNGDVRHIVDARAVLDELTVAKGLAAGTFGLYVGEDNWTNRRLPDAGSADPLEDFQHIRAFGASFVTALICHTLTADADLEGWTYAHVGTVGEYGDGSPLVYGYAGLQLIGPNLEHWASYNVMQGLQSVLGRERLTAALILTLAGFLVLLDRRDSATGRAADAAPAHPEPAGSRPRAPPGGHAAGPGDKPAADERPRDREHGRGPGAGQARASFSGSSPGWRPSRTAPPA
jgi:hypothetical protein